MLRKDYYLVTIMIVAYQVFVIFFVHVTVNKLDYFIFVFITVSLKLLAHLGFLLPRR